MLLPLDLDRHAIPRCLERGNHIRQPMGNPHESGIHAVGIRGRTGAAGRQGSGRVGVPTSSETAARFGASGRAGDDRQSAPLGWSGDRLRLVRPALPRAAAVRTHLLRADAGWAAVHSPRLVGRCRIRLLRRVRRRAASRRPAGARPCARRVAHLFPVGTVGQRQRRRRAPRRRLRLDRRPGAAAHGADRGGPCTATKARRSSRRRGPSSPVRSPVSTS